MKYLALFTVFFSSLAFPWGELGHHLVGRTAAKIVAEHPALKPKLQTEESVRLFVSTLSKRMIHQGHISNVPDIHWKNLDGEEEKDGRLLGDFTHFIDPERFVDNLTPTTFFTPPIPLQYAKAKEAFETKNPNMTLFREYGTLPWRAQQFTQLYHFYLKSLHTYDGKECRSLTSLKSYPLRPALTAAGLLSHFIGDAAVPHHATADYDGVAAGQKGIHSYFETDIVDALALTLEQKVPEMAVQLLQGDASVPHSVAHFRKRSLEVYPQAEADQKITALVLALSEDSYAQIAQVMLFDKTYAIATDEEAAKLCKDQKPCRRSPTTTVDGMSIAQRFEPMIVQRLALASAVLADIWVQTFLDANTPRMCWSWLYGARPGFVSPTDPKCFGYVDESKEKPAAFTDPNGNKTTGWKKMAPSTEACLTF